MLLVTGGAGFIGSHLVEALVARGDAVRVFDNFSTGSWCNLAAVVDRIEVQEGDLRDAAAVRRAVSGIDVIFHLAAIASAPASIADPETTYAVNVRGTLRLLRAARDLGCRRLIYASSSSVYGDHPALPKREQMPADPKSPYASSKLTGEHLCGAFTQLYHLETVALRYFNVFGPRQNPDSAYAAVVPRFLSLLRQGIAPVIYGDGQQSRDFVYIDDVVAANLLAATAPAQVVSGRVFNIASGTTMTVSQVFARLSDALDVKLEPRFEAARDGDIRDSRANISAARDALGFQPRVSFTDGLARIIAAGERCGRPEGNVCRV
jgi:UDP-glucose 4-epimerase